jgi:sigma-B regulation protein RsbU (phosphoserine phosphatase)
MSDPAPAAPSILVVDDTPANLAVVSELLRDRYRVRAATSGAKALELAKANPPDLVLLDIMMPGLSGYDVLERLRADPALCHVPVIMVSAVDELQSVIRCIKLGAEDYLSKPIEPTLLDARVGASLEKKRLRDEVVRHAKRMERELETARAIQLSMVPVDFPRPDATQHLAVYATLQPARELGGDLYDCFWIAEHRLCLVVADVSDKGAHAALHMARTKTVVRLLATLLGRNSGKAPAATELLERINDELCRDNPLAMFVTMFLCVVDARTGEMEWCNAGHPIPYVVAPRGSVTRIGRERSLPAGLQATADFVSGSARLEPGESLFVYTDGIPEAESEQGEFFGEERLEAALRSHADHAPERLVRAVLQQVRAFAGAAAPFDDIAALACRRLA